MIDASMVNLRTHAHTLSLPALIVADMSWLGCLDVQFVFFRDTLLRGTGLDLNTYREAPYPAHIMYRILQEPESTIDTAPAVANLLDCKRTGIPIMLYGAYHAQNPPNALVTINDVNSSAWDRNILLMAIVKDHKIVSAHHIQELFVQFGAYVHAVKVEKIDGIIDGDPLLDQLIIISSRCPALFQVLSQLVQSD
jgi:hypothetical protein